MSHKVPVTRFIINENQSPREANVRANIRRVNPVVRLVLIGGLSLLFSVGIRAIAKIKVPIVITMSCHGIYTL